MRHAKSSWTEEGKTDFERSLNKRGRRVAPQMGAFAKEQGLVPDRIVSSSATRAHETTMLFAESCGVEDSKIEYVKDLYHAPAEEYLELLTRYDQAVVGMLMIVGHNPGLEELVYQLGRLYEPMPTCAIAHFDLGAEEWIAIRHPFKASLKQVWRPRDIGFD